MLPSYDDEYEEDDQANAELDKAKRELTLYRAELERLKRSLEAVASAADDRVEELSNPDSPQTMRRRIPRKSIGTDVNPVDYENESGESDEQALAAHSHRAAPLAQPKNKKLRVRAPKEESDADSFDTDARGPVRLSSSQATPLFPQAMSQSGQLRNQIAVKPGIKQKKPR
jgi:hypothetical protein